MASHHRTRNRVSLNSRFNIFLIITCTVFYGLIIYFILTTPQAVNRARQREPLNALLKLDESVALTVLRVLQGIVSLASTSAISGALEMLQWCMAARPQGLGYVRFLVFSPATGVLGTLGVFFSWSPIKLTDRLWALTKLGTLFFVWLAALLLFVNTSKVTIHDKVTTFDVTAGYGPFNASYVEPFFRALEGLSPPDYPFQVLPYSYHGNVHNLIVNPTESSAVKPVSCRGEFCDSYFLSGGILMTTPWVASMTGGSALVMVSDIPGVQLDFDYSETATGPSPDFNLTADCTTYGQNTARLASPIAIQLCIKPTEGNPQSLSAGLFVCRDGISPAGACQTTYPTPNITTTLTLFTRQATILAATHNFSIVSTTDLSPARPFTIDSVSSALPQYRRVLSWLLDYNATNIPAVSSLAEYFWSSDLILSSPGSATEAAVAKTVLKQQFQSILAFPVWMFNANNFGNVELAEKEMVQGLPAEFYTTASVIHPYDKMKVDTLMFVCFVALQGVVILVIWGIMGWVWWFGMRKTDTGGGPTGEGVKVHVSAYPLFDCAMKMTSVTDERALKGVVSGMEEDKMGSARWMDLSDGGVLEFALQSRVYVVFPGERLEGRRQEVMAVVRRETDLRSLKTEKSSWSLKRQKSSFLVGVSETDGAAIIR